ncbi:MAG: choice-of-anchor D domain-containing protein [Verrucomicrobiota bacterium]
MKIQGKFPTLPALSAVLIAGLAFPATVLADFKGGDTLKTVIASNWFYSPNGGGIFENASSRLEFVVETPTVDNSAFLTWKVNEGSRDQNWYVQADAYLDLIGFPTHGDGIELGLGILPSEENGPRFFTVSLNRNRNNRISNAGITVIDPELMNLWEERTKARAATLRLHFNKVSKTITPSWNTGSGWNYGAPRDLTAWNMKSSETFRAVLFARNGVTQASSGKVASGQAYFKNFKVGNATPEIVVEKSSSELQDKKGTVPFGAAKTDVGKVTKTFRIRNHGTASLTGLKLSVIGAQAGDFTLSNIVKRSLAPGDTTTFKIAFRPKAPGMRNATVFLTSNDPDESAFGIKVSGRGVE